MKPSRGDARRYLADSTRRRQRAARPLCALLVTVLSFVGFGAAPAFADPCVNTVSGLWSGNYTSSQGAGGGTWSGQFTFSAAVAPDNESGSLFTPFPGTISGTVSCAGAMSFSITDSGGGVLTFSTGSLDSATQTAAGGYSYQSGGSTVDSGTWTGGLDAPTVAGLAPANGPPSGGTEVTISGRNFASATDVYFGETQAAAFTVVSNTQITATSPAGTGSVDVHVIAIGGTSPEVVSDQFVYATAYPALVLSNDPLAYWRLGGDNGFDSSGHGRDGSFSCTSLDAPGAIADDADTAASVVADGCGMQFTPQGSDSYAGDFTAEAWVKATGPVSKKWRTVVSARWPDGAYGPDGELFFDFKLSGTTAPGGQQLYVDVGDGSNWLVNGGVPFAWSTAQWYHVAVTVDSGGGAVTFFVNGQQIGSLPMNVGGDPALFDDAHPIAVGQNGRYVGLPDAEYFNGVIDEVALYPGVLAKSDLQSHYALGAQGVALSASLGTDSPTVPSVSGVAESSLPASAIEVGASTSSAGNTSSAPLRSIALTASTIGTIPLRSIPLRSIALRSVLSAPAVRRTLSSTLLSDIPVTFPAGCTGSDCDGWPGLLRGSPLAINPLQSTTLADVLSDPTASATLESLPLSVIDLSSSPLRSIPLAAVALAGVPLRSIPLPGSGTTASSRVTAWCSLLVTLGSSCSAFGINPANPASADAVDLLTLSLGGVTLDSVPLRSIPLTSIDITTSPLRSIPLRSIDLDSTPLRSIPLRSIPLRSIPLGAIPLRSIATPSAVVDCSAVDCSPSSTATLGDAEAAGAVRASATLADLEGLDSTPLRSIPLRSIDMETSPLRSIPLRSIDLDSTPLRSIPLRSIPLRSIPLGAIPLRSIATPSAVVVCSAVDCSSSSTATLGDAEAAGAVRALATLADLEGLDSTPLRSIPLRSIDMETSPLRSIPLRSIDGLSSVVDCTLVDCSADSTATLGDAAAADALLVTATLDQLGPFLGAALGDLSASDYNDATLADLGAFLGTLLGDLLAQINASTPGFPSFTLTDLLRGLVPATSYPWQSINIDSLPPTLLGSGSGSGSVVVTSNLTWQGATPQPVRAAITLPPGFTYVPDSSEFDDAPIGDPTVSSGDLVWTPTLDPGLHTLSLSVATGLGIGPATATLSLSATDLPTVNTSTSFEVVDSAEPNDAATSPTDLVPDQLSLSYLSRPGDGDWWSIDVAQGNELSLSLSNLPADYDLALFSPVAAALQSAVPQQAPGVFDAAPSAASSAQPPAGGNEVDVTAPSGYQLFALSANRDKTAETVQTPPLAGGAYLVHITGYNGAWNNRPYLLRATGLATPAANCTISYPNSMPAPASLPSSYPSGLNTIFLVNSQRLAAAYGSTAAQQVMTNLTTVANDSAAGVIGAIVPVDGDAATRTAYSSWNANSCDVAAANGVVARISSLVNSIRASRPTVANVVIVGADDQIPFARIADGTVLSNERDYGASTFPGESNVLAEALTAGYYFSDDPLTARQPLSVGSATLYVPQLATGRLVETPAQIVGALQRFVSSHGVLNASSALSTGYSFLSGGAELVATNLAKVSGRTVASLIGDDWTRDELDDALHASPKPTIDSLNAHFDFSRALPAAGNTTGQESDLFTTDDVRNSSSTYGGSLLFSMGCHSGLNASAFELATSGVTGVDDWTKTFADSGALWVGNTGFGYADSDAIAYSAKLMAAFAGNLDASVSVGAALSNAKQTSSAGNALLSPYDLKSFMESTFFGLPMYQLNNTPPSVPPPPAPPSTFTDAYTGLTAANISAGQSPLSFHEVTAANGSYYEVVGPNPQLQTTEFRPIEPLTTSDITQPSGSGGGLAMLAHGALITSLASTDHALPTPAVSVPGVDSASDSSTPLPQDPFPATLLRVATYQTSSSSGSASRQQLDMVLGQYLPGSGSGGTQRLFPSLTAQVLYTPTSNTNFTPPTIISSTGYTDGAQELFAVTASDPGAPIKRVTALYTDAENPGAWTSIELTSTDGLHFTGAGAATASGEMAYIVQAVDGSGNVAIATNKGAGFPAAPPPVAPSIDSPAVATFTVGTPGSFEVTATGTPVPTLSAVGTLPSGLAFDPTTGELSGTPALGSAGTYVVNISANSGEQLPRATQVLTIFVAGPGSAVKPWISTLNQSALLSSSPSVVNVPVALSWASSTPVTVKYATLNGTALSGRDFEATSGTLTFAPGQTLKLVPVTIDPYAGAGPNLSFKVSMTGPVGAAIGYGAALVTLVDPLGPLTAYVDDPVARPASSGQTMRFTVSLSSPVASGRTATIPYATASGTAISETDFTSTSGTLTFTAGQSSKIVNVPLLNGAVSSAKTFKLVLGKVVGALAVDKTGVATIAPVASTVKPWISTVQRSALLSSSASVVNVPVALSWASSTPVTVQYATLKGTALAGRDFEATSGTLTFAPGETLKQVPVTIPSYAGAGPNLTFSVTMKLPVGAGFGLSKSLVTLVDPLGPLNAYVNDPVAQPTSSGQVMTFGVSLSSPVAAERTVTIPYATASATAIAGTNFTPVSGTLSFTAGQSFQTVNVPLLNASVSTAKTFKLILGKVVGALAVDKTGVATIAPG